MSAEPRREEALLSRLSEIVLLSVAAEDETVFETGAERPNEAGRLPSRPRVSVDHVALRGNREPTAPRVRLAGLDRHRVGIADGARPVLYGEPDGRP